MTAGLLVIGSGPAGVSAAEAFRNHQPDASIAILTSDTELPYVRPPLSKDFLQGKSDDVELHPQQWYDERSITLHLGVTVDGIDVERQTVTAGGRRFDYRALVMACGATPSPLPVPGGEQAFLLRSFADASTLREAAFRAGTAVVIGAGFIGCEAAASLAAQGISVSLVAPESAPQVNRLGEEAGQRLLALVEAAEVHFFGGVEVAAIDGESVELDNGTSIDADLILAATGVTPNSDLAATAGLDIRDSRIVVGSDMSTSQPNIYAAGDVALAYNETAGRHLAVEHWQDAMDQGAVAGAVAAGGRATWDGVPGFWSTIGDATVKYHAWGDGYAHTRFVDHSNGFTIWYSDGAPEGTLVGVLTFNADDDYDAGEQLIRQQSPKTANGHRGTPSGR
jgi:3-phenylpropionate/trans-cinnamate dioxygenase ferredoxin reductase component